ncbi:kinesin-like protein KIF18B isoform X3 [Pogoniulus pusillus]|uniref:kinesin-like protein KIF18B isoform X3 n=1 Tax=Pogoniulus pusillus TaxID=488313 RepID=UPI0030B9AAEF
MALVPPPQEGTVAVMVRVRPPAAGERAAQQPLLRVVDHKTLVFDPEGLGGASGPALPARGTKHPGKQQKFVFDRVFGEQATQEEVFQHTTRDMVDTVLDGYNCSVFAYGATGAGKSFTMMGSEQSPGIIYLAMVELYKQLEARKEKSYEVLVSYQEVYNEQLHDLLEPKGPLSIWEDPEKGAVVQGLSLHQPSSAEQLLQMVVSGNRNRTQHPTDANACSSRSHAVFQVYVKQQACAGGPAGHVQVAKMSLVDLAGSERASVAKTRGKRLREGASINRSLLALIGVITALAGAKGPRSHVPYRDSKLTRLLKDCLGGNCRTLMLAVLSPSPLAYEDTYNTLKYASRAKEIEVSLQSNLRGVDCHVCKYRELCEQLRAEVAELRAKLRANEDAASGSQCQGPALLPALASSPLQLPRDGAPASSRALNVTHEVCTVPASASGPGPLGCSVPEALEQRQSLQDQQDDAPSGAKAAAPAMSFSPRQQPLPRDGSFLAQDAAPEALEAVGQQEAAAGQKQVAAASTAAELSRASPAQRSQQGWDGQVPAKASVAVPAAPLISSPLPDWQHLAPLTSATLLALSPIRKRGLELLPAAVPSTSPTRSAPCQPQPVGPGPWAAACQRPWSRGRACRTSRMMPPQGPKPLALPWVGVGAASPSRGAAGSKLPSPLRASHGRPFVPCEQAWQQERSSTTLAARGSSPLLPALPLPAASSQALPGKASPARPPCPAAQLLPWQLCPILPAAPPALLRALLCAQPSPPTCGAVPPSLLRLGSPLFPSPIPVAVRFHYPLSFAALSPAPSPFALSSSFPPSAARSLH